MFKTKFASKTNLQKTLAIVCAAILIALIVGVVLGIVNAFFADGEWGLWSSYSYEEEGYQVGSSTVPSDRITSIDIDWIDGDVKIVVCQDAFASVTETYKGTLSENKLLRWSLDESRTNFSVKYRKSTAFLGFGDGGEEKKLIVRIPERMLGEIASITVNSKSSVVSLEGVSADALTMVSTTGTLSVTGGTYRSVAISTSSGNVYMNTSVSESAVLLSKKGNITFSNALNAKSVTASSEHGNVELFLPETVGFTLTLTCDADRFVSDRTLQGEGNVYTYGDGSAKISLSSERGAVRLYTRKE